ncbi:TRAP transporter small permease [Paracoccus laeviglucosivorans]|uniref:TRAP transporter small permease protein n=1 Tax=Paracoccus laeviglucosivorans TaxID=1197861 RepID=A0A521E8T5_9RHOB|nr:TRAP transporter small permease [Paracoccus laeviglucosivorans]SMO80327.1 TRAP-type C4-dicarboxylate transport system, small permease component [Paracoccus laeviglucosivorans]
MADPKSRDSGTEPGWLGPVDRIMDGIATIMLTCAEILLALMLALNMVNIVMRNFGFGSLLWVSAWTGVMMVWCVFMAFFPMYRRGMDITLGFFVGRFGPGPNRIFQMIAAICGIVVCGVLVLELPQILSRQRGVMELVGLQRYWLSIPMVLSAALIVVHFLLELAVLAFGWRAVTVADETEQLQW